MGIDLDVLGNHDLQLAGLTVEEKINLVKNRLERLNFSHVASLQKNSSLYITKEKLAKNEWQFAELQYSYLKGEALYFDGPFNQHIVIGNTRIEIYALGIRYKVWMGWENFISDDERNEWRKYFFELITGLGGNRAIYFPDSVCKLASYFDLNVSLEEMEKIITENVAIPHYKFKPMEEEYDDCCWIDYFEDID